MSILPERSSTNSGVRFSNRSKSTIPTIAVLDLGAATLTGVHCRLKQVDERLMNAFCVDAADGPCGAEHLPGGDEHPVGKTWRRSSIDYVH